MSQTLQFTRVTTTPINSVLVSDRPRYLGWVPMLMVAVLVWANASLSFNVDGPPRDNLIQQLAVYGLFCFAWFGWLGLRLSNAVFATVALGPAILAHSYAYGYFYFPFAALTPADLMVVIAIGLWLVRGPKLKLNNFTALALSLFTVCALSASLTLNRAFLGGVVRLALAVILVWIIFSEPGQTLKRAFVNGMLLWPVAAVAHIAGTEGLWMFFSFEGGAALNPYATGEVIYGTHQVPSFLIFLLPLAIYHSKRVLQLPLLIAIAPYIIFSFSRRLFISIFIAVLTYLLNHVKSSNSLKSAALLALITTGIVVSVNQLGFISWSTNALSTKGNSNIVRYAKIWNTWNTYLGSPILGIGYGASGAIDAKEKEKRFAAAGLTRSDSGYYEQFADVKASSEFTPIQILAETGTLGGVLSAWLIIFAGLRMLRVLRSPNVPHYIQLAIYCWMVVFISGFLGSNAFNTLIFMLAIPVAAYEAYLRPLQTQHQIAPLHSPQLLSSPSGRS